MVLDSLREALARIADTPVLWITGLFMGALFAVDLLLQAGGYTTLGSRIGFLGLCALPFFLGGSSGAIRGDDPGLRGYLRAGARYYFRILLAGAVIVAVAFLTVFLVMIPFSLLGEPLEATMSLSLLGVIIPFAFFTYFFDTAVVFEDRKVLDSIRRSVEFTMGDPKRTVGFYLVNLAIGFLILLASSVIWSLAIADRLQPLVDSNQTVFQMNLTAEQMMNLIGVPGLRAGVVIGFFAVLIGGTLLLSFKACLFRRYALTPGAQAPQQGEFDEKGRWYRY
jgi:hypothetical protein